ncbi:MAG: ABC transporter substrate-binding protein [Halanaerobiales bacterium]
MQKLKKLCLILTLIFLLTGSIMVSASEVEVLETENNELEDHDIASFGQAPEFEEMVESGDLPPVEERLPEEPFVVEPYEEIGSYGGTATVGTPQATISGADAILMDAFNGFVQATPQADDIIVNFAKKIESSADKSTWTIHLREGVKWSDGEPFTTEDIEFWYEDMLLNEDITPVIGDTFKAKGEVMDLEILDDYTFRIEYAAPKPYFLNNLTTDIGWNFLYPKHYLKNFHPNYTDEDELEEKMEKADYDNWYELFQAQNEGWAQVFGVKDRPVLTPYKIVINKSNRRVYERNPYYWKVDSDGNQLPYFDQIEVEVFGEREVIKGRIMSGELDFAGFNTEIRDYPMYRNYEDEGDYKTILWNSGKGNEVQYMVNMTHEDKVLREIFQDVKFRRALSLAIDREEINEAIYFGKAEPRQMTVVDSSMYFEPEFAEAYVEYDPDRANELLDEVGLDEKDSDGYRLRPDGEKLTFTIEFYDAETPKAPNVELVMEHWKDVGIDVNSKQVSGELQEQRAPANLMDATLWHAGQTTDILFNLAGGKLVSIAPGWERTMYPLWARWFETDGEEGEEPSEEIKEVYGWWEEMQTEPDLDKRIELGKNILRSQAENLWAIGTVGNAPHPVIVGNDIGNAAPGGMDYMWAWDNKWSMCTHPEQMYFKN